MQLQINRDIRRRAGMCMPVNFWMRALTLSALVDQDIWAFAQNQFLLTPWALAPFESWDSKTLALAALPNNMTGQT